MTLTEQLIELIENKRIEDEDVEAASWFMLDAMANIAAGRNSEQGRILTRWFLEVPADSSRKVLWLGSLMHILEMDDLHRNSVVHPGCVVIPAVLAVGLREGVSGRKMLEATLKGFEVCTRIGNSVGPAHYKIWHNTSTCGPFGAAYAAGTLLGLNSSELSDALGNAGTQSSGLWEFVESGSMSKHLHAGRAGQSGLIAAELARHGFSGSPTILEGTRGFYAACCPDASPEELLANPDDRWQLHQTSIKPWPCCRHTRPAIDAATELSGQLAGKNPDTIELGVTQAAIDVCNNPNPESVYEAKFSLQHCVSVALLNGKVVFESFESEARKLTAGLNNKVSIRCDEKIEQNYPEAWGVDLRVKMKDGKVIKVHRDHAKGDPDAPLTAKEMREKAVMLFSHGGMKEPEKWVERILGLPQEPSFSESDIYRLLNITVETAEL